MCCPMKKKNDTGYKCDTDTSIWEKKKNPLEHGYVTKDIQI